MSPYQVVLQAAGSSALSQKKKEKEEEEANTCDSCACFLAKQVTKRCVFLGRRMGGAVLRGRYDREEFVR